MQQHTIPPSNLSRDFFLTSQTARFYTRLGPTARWLNHVPSLPPPNFLNPLFSWHASQTDALSIFASPHWRRRRGGDRVSMGGPETRVHGNGAASEDREILTAPF